MVDRLVGFHATRQGDRVTIVTSDGDVIDTPPFGAQLTDKFSNCCCIAYDLDLFVACFLRAIEITKEQGAELNRTEHLSLPPWRLTYFPSKFFSIDYSSGFQHPFVNFANANQQGYGEARYDSLDMTIEDAVVKAKEARDIGLDVRRIFTELGLDNSNINSPVTPFIKKFTLKWATASDIPNEINKMAMRAVKGHQFEVFKLGLFDAIDMDINSSYVYHLSYLPDISRGEFVHIKGNDIPDNATLGVADGLLQTKASLHPFLVDVSGIKMTPNGKMPNTLTLFDIRFMRDYKLGQFDISEGHYWIPKGQQYEVYKGAGIWLWKQRLNAVGRKRLILQRIYSSLVGKQVEGLVSGKLGMMFNPIIPAHVEAASRIQVVKTCIDHKISPIAITGDGFVTDAETGIECNDDLGGWKLRKQGKCLSVGSNVIIFQDGKNNNDYETLMSQIEADPTVATYSKLWYSPISLAVALQQTWDDLGKLHRLDRTFRMDAEAKRIYPVRPKNGGMLIKGRFGSLPWQYDTLARNSGKIAANVVEELDA